MAGIVGADELNDRKKFQSLYRTGISHEFVGAALAEIARTFAWKKMAIISQEESLFLRVCNTTFIGIIKLLATPAIYFFRLQKV